MTPHALEELEKQLRGSLVIAGDAGYDAARRVYNATHDCRPRAVVRAENDADAMATVRFARREGLELAVRGGGHSVPGYGTCDEGLVLDLSPIRYVRVDPRTRTARVGGGALIGDVDHAAHAYALGLPAGFVSTTGMGGLTLGGGFGYLSRRWGLTCDSLLSADVVTAEGERVTASSAENADLFWALRGGGGNFGIVTSFEYRLHPVKDVVGGPIFFELDAAAALLDFFRTWIAGAPRELGAFFGFHVAPPLPFIPEERHGDTLCAVVVCWSGDPDRASELLDPLREAGPVVAEHVDHMPYPALQSAFDPLLPAGLQHYWKSDFVADLTDDAIAAHLAHGPKVPNVHSTMHLYPLDGAIHDTGPDETAFPCRDGRFSVNIVGVWNDPSEEAPFTRWVRDYYDAIHPHSGYEGGYTNFMAAEDQRRVRENYGAAYERLARVKARWDPDNVFHRNQNVEPLGTGARETAT